MDSSRHIHRTDPFRYYARLGRLKLFVEESYREPISAERAARVAGLATKYFSTFFHEKVGQTFSAWLRQYRIAKAKELMGKSNLSMSRVAMEVGFADTSTFLRAFKSLEKMTPSEFQRRVRPNVSYECDCGLSESPTNPAR